MKLDDPLEPESLAVFGEEVVEMLCRGHIESVANRYGYALSYGRNTALAIQDDLNRCLSEVGATALVPPSRNPVRNVQYYEPNAANLVAVVECLAPTDKGLSLLVELVVTSHGSEKHITLEDISAVPND